MELEIVFQHGWAFDKRCWTEWMKYERPGLKMSALDRGYFGQPEAVDFSPGESRKILISHSFGLFLLPDHLLKKADILVSISGFRQFHTTGREGKFSKRLISLMLKRFGSGSFDVTGEFRAMCGAKEASEIIATEDGFKKLAEDLERLSYSALDVEPLKSIPYVLLVQGTDDRVVWPERAKDLKASIPGSRLIMVEGAGHGLPFTHYEECLEIVKNHSLANILRGINQ